MTLESDDFLPDEADCAAAWRAARWPDGVSCVRCGREQIECRTEEYREHYHRYECLVCGKWFNDFTDTALAYSKVRLHRWVYLIRELEKGQPVTQISEDLGVTYKTALEMAHTVREAIYAQQMTEKLSDEVEGDDIHVKGGRQGKDCERRPPRSRGLSQRGRGTYQGDRPLIGLWVERDSPRMVSQMQRDASKRTLFDFAHEHIEAASRVDTDSWQGYNLLDACYDHQTVKHSECYVDDDVHCNTAEAEWSIFKPWWRTFRGVAKHYIYRYLAAYQFRRNHRDQSVLERMHQVLAFLWAFVTGFQWRRPWLFRPVSLSVF